MKKKVLLQLIVCLFSIEIFAQNEVTNLINIKPDTTYNNVFVSKITSDSLSTAFVIWVKKGVKAHYHALHTENIYVLEGTAEMTVGENTFPIQQGDFFIVPKGTHHSVVVTSETPLKIISIQTPEFFGKDRIWVE